MNRAKAASFSFSFNEAVSLLQATLEEEKDTDEKLSKLAVTPINQTAEAAE